MLWRFFTEVEGLRFLGSLLLDLLKRILSRFLFRLLGIYLDPCNALVEDEFVGGKITFAFFLHVSLHALICLKTWVILLKGRRFTIKIERQRFSLTYGLLLFLVMAKYSLNKISNFSLAIAFQSTSGFQWRQSVDYVIKQSIIQSNLHLLFSNITADDE